MQGKSQTQPNNYEVVEYAPLMQFNSFRVGGRLETCTHEFYSWLFIFNSFRVAYCLSHIIAPNVLHTQIKNQVPNSNFGVP